MMVKKEKPQTTHVTEKDVEEDIIDKEVQRQQMRGMQKPYDALDGDWLQTEPAYGKEAEPGFYDLLKTITGNAEPMYNPDGTPKLDSDGRQMFAVETRHLWDEFAFFTRDLRLGNLKKGSSDSTYCEHFLALAGDCLSMGCVKSFASAYRRMAGKLEISQSVGGFFRKNRNTIRSVKEQRDLNAADKGLFGGKRQQNGE